MSAHDPRIAAIEAAPARATELEAIVRAHPLLAAESGNLDQDRWLVMHNAQLAVMDADLLRLVHGGGVACPPFDPDEVLADATAAVTALEAALASLYPSGSGASA